MLRLEDTDRTRSDEAFVHNLYDTFSWLGIHWDEGPDTGGPFAPYVQSQRTERYKACAQRLLEAGRAYRCFCSPQRLERLRAEREAAHSSETGYDRACRNLGAEESARRAASGEPFTIRLTIPLGGGGAEPVTRFTDVLLGDIVWKNADVNPDPVLLKSDGFPTYHLANVVDDHAMEISHVLRAQEWLSSTPLHVLLYESFGWTPPEFCHLPMVMGEDGKKLSKRHGATSIDEFRRLGCLPEALVNYVAMLGCSYEEGRDLYTPEELGRLFSLEKLNKAPAVFDYKKLEWYNGQYIRMKDDEALARLALPYAVEQGLFGGGEPDGAQRSLFTGAMGLVRERAVYLADIPAKLGYLFREPEMPAAGEFIPKKGDAAAALELLRMGREFAEAAAGLDDGRAEELAKAIAGEKGVKLGDLLTPLRAALTGARVSPPLFGSLRLLGVEKSLARIDRALEVLAAAAAAR